MCVRFIHSSFDDKAKEEGETERLQIHSYAKMHNNTKVKPPPLCIL